MQRLKFELLNGYGVLVDEKAKIKEGDWILEKGLIINQFPNYLTDLSECNKILFAEKELGLDVPVFEWRDFEVEKLAKQKEEKEYSDVDPFEPCGYAGTDFYQGFIQGYKSNPAKYTEEDLWKLISEIRNQLTKVGYNHYGIDYKKCMESLQKYPKYVVMESELKKGKYLGRRKIGVTPAGESTYINDGYEEFEVPKLFTNSEGKQQGTVKELIWE
jgi:hypothetical protein